MTGNKFEYFLKNLEKKYFFGMWISRPKFLLIIFLISFLIIETFLPPLELTGLTTASKPNLKKKFTANLSSLKLIARFHFGDLILSSSNFL